MNGSDLKMLCAEARPIIERMLDDAETLAAFREAATNKGLDWSQVKALLKAQIQDERDGEPGKRIGKIIERADHASAYADMLGFSNMNENNFSAERQAAPAEERSPPIRPTPIIADPDRGRTFGADHIGTNMVEGDGIPEFLDARKRVHAVPAA